ncbi:MAG: hypothetical protein EBU97_05965 [Rhodobacteraceae bacterium]|nr:hypothetical protein [Paracoccaceae bacterium]
MTRWPVLIVALGLLIWFLLTARRFWQAAMQRRAARAGYLAQAEALLTTPRRQMQDSGYLRIAGQWQGGAFDLQVVPDTLSYRKLPCLWLLVSRTDPLPALAGEVRIMARASGLEAFSTFSSLPIEVTLPPGFPPDCTLRCTDPQHVPPLAVLDHVAGLMADPRVKEVVLSPKGLRIVILAEEGARGAYLIHRDAEFATEPLDAALVARRMQDLRALAQVIHG